MNFKAMRVGGYSCLTCKILKVMNPRQRINPTIKKQLIMGINLATFFMLISILTVSAASYAQKITLNERRASLEQLLDKVRQQSGYNIVYSDELLSKSHSVTLNLKDASLEDALKAILADQSLTYEIENKTIIVKERDVSLLDKAKVLFAQVTISGKVQDETGQPMVGVTVRVKGSNSGTQTDKNGSYSLTVPDDKTIVAFSFVGYETVELAAKDIPIGSVITLKATQTNLREVIVNKGYYTERQALSTGSTSRVTAKEIGEQPVSDPIMALEGRVPGLSISQASGMPGAAYNIQLRGRNSIQSGTNPLYIVDGVPFSANTLSSPFVSFNAFGTPTGPPNPAATTSGPLGLSPFNSLDPSDIEDIQVLKDADATAIYGSRGANGVILITTKKGKAGQTKVDVNFYSGEGQVTRMVPLMNTQQYLAMRHEGLKNDGVQPDPTYDFDLTGAWDTTRYTNWQKYFIGGTAHFTNAQANISGGTANTQFLIGGGYSNQTTVFPGDYGDQKGSAHTSITHTSNNQKFHTQFSTQYSYDRNTSSAVDFTKYITLAPDAPALYDSQGNLNWQNNTWSNPLLSTLKTNTASTTNLVSSLNLGYQILPGLKAQSNVGYTHAEMNQSNIQPATINPGPAISSLRKNYFGTSSIDTWIAEPQLEYNRNTKIGKFDILVGSSIQRTGLTSTGFVASNFPSDAQIPNVSAATSLVNNGYLTTQYRYSAVYARINYNLEDKYILNITGRRDGSSRFGPGKQFGDFGAAGASWIFSKEKFVADNFSFLSFGKLRASYGSTGNDQITDYQFLSTYSFLGGSPYQGVNGLVPNRIANPDFAWERNNKMEAGIELGFLNDRVNLNVDYYRNRTANQLVGYPLPSIDGFTTVQYNLPAVIQNTGLEAELNTVNVQSAHFSWTSAFNISVPRNKLVSYPNIASSTYKTTYEVGQPLSVTYIFHGTGVDPQTGLYTFQDVNKDGQITDADRQFVAGPVQNYYGGFQNNFSYRNWSLDIFFQFVKQTGRSIMGSYQTNPPGVFNNNVNQPIYVLNHWRTPGDKTTVQQYTTGYSAASYAAYNEEINSDQVIVNASFIRLKNISLSYTLPTKWQQSAHLQNARLYLQCQNLLTITRYKGLDPETGGLSLPPLRMMTIGFQVSL